jgi:hypothetical protein
MTRAARTLAFLGTLRKARSQIEPGIWRGKAWNGRASQAFALVEFGVVDRATANSSLRTAAGHKQDDQTAQSKPPAGNCSRILDQSLGSTRARSSRNRPLEWPSTTTGACSKVGWTIPAIHAKANSLRIEHPIRTLTYRTSVTCQSSRNLCLSYDNWVLQERAPPRDASAGRSRPWPGCCPRQGFCPIPGKVDSW